MRSRRELTKSLDSIQGMAMVEMAREIGRWIQALFPLCIELRDELELGYKSLVIMRDVFDQIRNSESR